MMLRAEGDEKPPTSLNDSLVAFLARDEGSE